MRARPDECVRLGSPHNKKSQRSIENAACQESNEEGLVEVVHEGQAEGESRYRSIRDTTFSRSRCSVSGTDPLLLLLTSLSSPSPSPSLHPPPPLPAFTPPRPAPSRPRAPQGSKKTPPKGKKALSKPAKAKSNKKSIRKSKPGIFEKGGVSKADRDATAKKPKSKVTKMMG